MALGRLRYPGKNQSVNRVIEIALSPYPPPTPTEAIFGAYLLPE